MQLIEKNLVEDHRYSNLYEEIEKIIDFNLPLSPNLPSSFLIKVSFRLSDSFKNY